MRLSTKTKCLLILSAGTGVSGLFQYLDLGYWSVSVLVIFATVALLVGLSDMLVKIRTELHLELHSCFEMQADRVRWLLGHLAANQHSLLGIVQRFPKVHMPVSDYSMKAENLEAILDILTTNKPRTILELGSGISTLIVAAWIKQEGEGRIISFEHDDTWASKTRYYLSLGQLHHFAEVRTVPLRKRMSFGYQVDWYDLEEAIEDIEQIDLLIVDGPPANTSERTMARLPAMEVFHQRLSECAVVFLDDGTRPGEKEIVKIWSRAFPNFRCKYYYTLTGYWIMTRVQDETVSL